jgi:putative ABC transport system permease protein
MYRYYFLLGLHNLRRNPVLTCLMVVTLAVGVAATISTATILHVMSGNPVPHKSDKLLVPLLDNSPARGYVPGILPTGKQMAYRDASNLLASGQGQRRTAIYDISGGIEPSNSAMPVQNLQGIATTRDFFSMFETPFLHGGAWSDADDVNGAHVAVLSKKQSQKLFGNDNPAGRRVRIFNQDFQVVGVLDDWQPLPRYMHLINGNGGPFNGEDNIYVPWKTAIQLQIRSNGSTSCSGKSPGPGFQGLLDSECVFIQFWFEVNNAANRSALQHYLDAYVLEQHRIGRYERRAPARLFDVMEWMNVLGIVSNDARLTTWLAVGFLLLCMVNTTGLLLAKFSTRSAEIGVRRALGASRAEIFRQFVVETGVIACAGALAGLALSLASLWLIRLSARDLASLANMDWSMLLMTLAVAFAASLLAGLFPTWRACQVTPALQLKSQ